MINSAKIRVNLLYKKESLATSLAIRIAEDLLKEMDNPHYRRCFSDEKIQKLNIKYNEDLKILICSAYTIIMNRKVGYKPIFIIKNSDFQRKLITIIPI